MVGARPAESQCPPVTSEETDATIERVVPRVRPGRQRWGGVAGASASVAQPFVAGPADTADGTSHGYRQLDPETYPNGRFARLQDPEGNPIQLWQPKW